MVPIFPLFVCVCVVKIFCSIYMCSIFYYFANLPVLVFYLLLSWSILLLRLSLRFAVMEWILQFYHHLKLIEFCSQVLWFSILFPLSWCLGTATQWTQKHGEKSGAKFCIFPWSVQALLQTRQKRMKWSPAWVGLQDPGSAVDAGRRSSLRIPVLHFF